MLAGRPLVASLALIPFFSGLDAAALERVAAGTRTRRFRRGEVIFHAGDPGDALFVIVSGEVKIAVPSESGEEAILTTLREGDVFGELALLDGAPRSATAAALVNYGDGRPAARQVPRAGGHRAGRSATPCSRRWPASCVDSRRTSRSSTSWT